MNINLKGNPKAKLTLKIIRNGKEYDLPFSWKIRNWFKKIKENFLRSLGFNVGFADILTQVGEAQYVDWLDVETQYVGWGTGEGEHDKDSIALFTEDSGGSPAYARVVATRTQPATDKIRYVGTLTSNGTKTITNAGVLTALTSGILIVASDFVGVPLEVGEGIKFQWDVEIT